MTVFYWSVEYFVSFIETLTCFVFCGAFLGKNHSFSLKKCSFICLILAAFIIMIGRIKLFSAVNTLITFVVVYISIELYYKAKIIRTIITFISFYAVLFTSDLMTTALTASIADSTISELFNNFSMGRVVAALTSKGILSIICITFYRIKTKRAERNIKSNVVFSLLSIILLLVSVSLYFNYSKNESEHTNFTLTIFFMIILLLVVTIFISITYFVDSHQRQKEFEFAKKQTQLLEQSLKEQENTFALWRKSIHDYKNTVLALEAMLNNGETDKLSSYLEKESKAFMHRAEYIHTGNSTIDTVINTKFAIAKEQGIDYTVNAVIPKKSPINDIHLAAILGNLIDNAIEASEKEAEPYIDIEITTAQSFLIIKIINKCTIPPKTSETTKRDRSMHGIGLKSVRQIIEDYDGEFDLIFKNGQAIAKIMIQN